MAVLEFNAVVKAAGPSAPGTHTGVLLDAESGGASMVCPILVVLPDNGNGTAGAVKERTVSHFKMVGRSSHGSQHPPEGRMMLFNADASGFRLPTRWPGLKPIFKFDEEALGG